MQEYRPQDEVDKNKNNVIFINDYTMSRQNILNGIIYKCNDSINKFGVPYFAEGAPLSYGNHLIFVYQNNQITDTKLLKSKIEEDINFMLGYIYPNVKFSVSVIEPSYMEISPKSNLLRKRENYVLDIGIYQKVDENMKKSSLQKK